MEEEKTKGKAKQKYQLHPAKMNQKSILTLCKDNKVSFPQIKMDLNFDMTFNNYGCFFVEKYAS